MDDQARIPPPNYTQIPNAIFELMADKGSGMTEAELRVILAIARKTFGWHKKRDKISISQLEKMTSLARASVVAGIDAAVKRGIVRKTADKNDKRGGFFYEMVVEDAIQPTELTSSKSELVQNLNQFKNYTGTSSKSELELVQNLNTQKKEKETIKERESGKEKSPARTPAVLAYFEIFPTQTLTASQVSAINEGVADLARWRIVLNDWSLNGWSPRSIGRMLNRYSSGRTVASEIAATPNGKSERKAPDYELVTAQPKRGLTLAERQKILSESRDDLP